MNDLIKIGLINHVVELDCKHVRFPIRMITGTGTFTQSGLQFLRRSRLVAEEFEFMGLSDWLAHSSLGVELEDSVGFIPRVEGLIVLAGGIRSNDTDKL